MLMVLVAIAMGLVLSACDRGAERRYSRKVSLERTFEFRPDTLLSRSRGDAADHPCIRGDYHHVYETDSGWYGEREVWLCCVSIDEILSDSFQCGPSLILDLLATRDPNYMKIRYCSLIHPTETEPTYIPVCIPAPLQAPETQDR